MLGWKIKAISLLQKLFYKTYLGQTATCISIVLPSSVSTTYSPAAWDGVPISSLLRSPFCTALCFRIWDTCRRAANCCLCFYKITNKAGFKPFCWGPGTWKKNGWGEQMGCCARTGWHPGSPHQALEPYSAIAATLGGSSLAPCCIPAFLSLQWCFRRVCHWFPLSSTLLRS